MGDQRTAGPSIEIRWVLGSSRLASTATPSTPSGYEIDGEDTQGHEDNEKVITSVSPTFPAHGVGQLVLI